MPCAPVLPAASPERVALPRLRREDIVRLKTSLHGQGKTLRLSKPKD